MRKIRRMVKTNLKIEDDRQTTTRSDSDTDKFNNLVREDYAQDIKLRKYFSWATFTLICFWLIAVLVTLNYFEHSTWVLVALITTSTIKVLGLYFVVLKYIFPI